MIIQFNKDKSKEFFDEFCSKIREDEVNRLPYSVWATLNNSIRNGGTIRLDLIEDGYDEEFLILMDEGKTEKYISKSIFSLAKEIDRREDTIYGVPIRQEVLIPMTRIREVFKAAFSKILKTYTKDDSDYTSMKKVADGRAFSNYHGDAKVEVDLKRRNLSVSNLDTGEKFYFTFNKKRYDALIEELNDGWEFSQILSRETMDSLRNYPLEAKPSLESNWINDTQLEIRSVLDIKPNLCYNNSIEDNKNKINESEEANMKNMVFKGLDFGVVTGDTYRISHLGLSVMNSDGVYVSYDADNRELVDVTLMDFNAEGMIYKMPVAKNQIEVSDVIIHNGAAMIVTDTNTDMGVTAVDPYVGELKVILPVKSLFGFDFYTKITCLFDMKNSNASKENPFGNMMPLMMMSNMSGDGNNDMMKMMMMSQMMGGDTSEIFSNPMMMMLLMGGDDRSDILPMMMMMSGGNPFGGMKKED